MCNDNPTDPILGQKLTIDDIVTENENEQPTAQTNNDTDNEFGSRGYDKSHDGAYAD
jgi:hypothetical protein